MIIISCVLLKRIRGQPLPPRRWSLGRYGGLVNVLGLCFLAPIYVFSFFPAATPVTATTMNWSIVMYAGMILFSTSYYVTFGRHTYTPPVTLVRRDI